MAPSDMLLAAVKFEVSSRITGLPDSLLDCFSYSNCTYTLTTSYLLTAGVDNAFTCLALPCKLVLISVMIHPFRQGYRIHPPILEN